MEENIKEILTTFIEQAKTNNLVTNHYPNNYANLRLKVGFGQGRTARIPWVSFLGENQTTSDGIYPVYLFYKEQDILILAYGLSETNTPTLNWNIPTNTQTIRKYFENNFKIRPARYGDSYVFQVYDLGNSSELNWNKIENDLHKILREYKAIVKNEKLNPSILNSINSDLIQKLLSENEFHFEKAKSKLNEFNSYKEPNTGFLEFLLKSFENSGSTYTQFVETLEKDSKEYQVLNIIAQLISYCDLNAADKNRLNEYKDKRTLARSFVRQTQWIENLLKYKINNNNIEVLSPSIKNAISYLNNPEKELTMLSENHREMASKNLLDESYNKNKFVDQIKEYFKPYNLTPQNPLNLTRIISNILYEFPNVKSLWFEDLKNEKKNGNANTILEIISMLNKSNFFIPHNLFVRFISGLLSKSFIILTGLSGSGKTKLAQAFAYWITENKNQYCIIPVGADWTNREPLLGFPNALEPGKYVKPENNVLDLLVEAGKEGNEDKPFFLILDEMNLSHVERYFADFLSTMESGEEIYLHSENNWIDDVPSSIKLPPNLFIIGTVNVDETTYMFSPKVLDRANVIDFSVSENEMEEFLNEPAKPDLGPIKGKGKEMAADFISKSRTKISKFDDLSEIKSILLEFFRELKKIGAEFGYRSASEIYRFAGILKILTKENDEEWTVDDIVDAAVIQKLLPKVHGSRSKLDPVLKTLAVLCFKEKDDFDEKIKLENIDFTDREKIKYPLSLEKIIRMRTRVIQDGFTSFTEA